MRFILYLSVLLMLLPLVFRRPFFGLCVYYVVSILQPKMLCWRGDFQDALLVGVPLVIGAIAFGARCQRVVPVLDQATGRIKGSITRMERTPLFEPAWPLAVFVLLILYIGLTRVIVPFPIEGSSYHFRSLCKVMFVTALLTGLVSDTRKFRILFIVIALSGAFWAIKAGLKIVILGPHQVYGKTYDNNLFALTSVMTLPMVFYFGLTVKHARWRTVLLVMSAFTCLGIIGSRSRAGFVAFGLVLLCMAWASRYRLRAVFAMLLVVTVTLAMSSREIIERVDSILAYRQDKSSQSRFYTWDVARALFTDSPLIGVGFNNFETAKDRYFGGHKAAHNIYLQNLSELGALGHPLWLAIVFGTMFSIYRFMRRSRNLPPDLRWAYYCARALLLGMVAFCVHGLFHNEEYLELMFAIVGLNIALQAVIARELRTHQIEEAAGSRTIATDEPPEATTESKPHHPGQLFGKPATLGAWIRMGWLSRGSAPGS